jgi:hypothetical protein
MGQKGRISPQSPKTEFGAHNKHDGIFFQGALKNKSHEMRTKKGKCPCPNRSADQKKGQSVPACIQKNNWKSDKNYVNCFTS